MSGSQVRFPKVSVAISNAAQAVQNTPQRILVTGQMTAAGSATDGALVEEIGAAGEEDAFFGEDSQIAATIRGIRLVNPIGRIDAIAKDDAGGGVPRVLDFTVAGTATTAGSATLVAGSEVNHTYTVAVAIGDTETDIADALVAAVTADTKCPFDASNVAGAVTLTAVNDGTVANDLGVEVITAAGGITISVVLTETTPGATDPTLTGILPASLERYQAIVWPWADTAVVRAFLLPRFNPDNAVLDGVAFNSTVDSLANHISAATENDQDLVVFAAKAQSELTGTTQNYLGPDMNEASYVKSGYFAGIRALRLTDGQSISQYVIATSSLDQFGGSALASLPYANTPITQLPTIKSGRGWTQNEVEQLNAAGRSIVGVNVTNTTGLVGEVVTTYLTDAASNPDVTFTFLNYVDTASQVREYRFNNLKARFGQSRLTQGSVSRGRSQANEATIRAYVEKLYQDLAGADFVLVQDGDDAIAFYKANLVITLDLASGTVTISDLTPIVTQLREIIMTMSIVFSIEG